MSYESFWDQYDFIEENPLVKKRSRLPDNKTDNYLKLKTARKLFLSSEKEELHLLNIPTMSMFCDFRVPTSQNLS